MMGIGNPGEVHDMLTLCDKLPEDICGHVVMEWSKQGMITGFKGPFEGFSENPTSLIIDELEKEGVEDLSLSLHKFEMSYEEVAKKIPELWSQQRQDFAIHLSAHTIKKIYIEQKSFSDGYSTPDIYGFIPEDNKAKGIRGESEMEYKMNTDDLVKEVNKKCGLDGQKYGGLIVEKSMDPGRFVDAYAYYLSLDKSPWNTILVKIPPFEGEITKEAVMEVVRSIIQVTTA